MGELDKLKQELKRVNQKAAKVKDLAADQRAEFGRKINKEKQEILAKINKLERDLLDFQ